MDFLADYCMKICSNRESPSKLKILIRCIIAIVVVIIIINVFYNGFLSSFFDKQCKISKERSRDASDTVKFSSYVLEFRKRSPKLILAMEKAMPSYEL